MLVIAAAADCRAAASSDLNCSISAEIRASEETAPDPGKAVLAHARIDQAQHHSKTECSRCPRRARKSGHFGTIFSAPRTWYSHRFC